MTSRTPRRSGKTQLTDDEVIILDALFDGAWHSGALGREDFEAIHNLTYRHDLSREELAKTLQALKARGLLHSEEGHPRGAYFHLTEEGGRLWDVERTPDWSKFVAIENDADSTGNRTTIFARSQSLEVAQTYLKIARECGYSPVILESQTSRLVPRFRVLPWKSLDQVHEVLAFLVPAVEGKEQIDWERYEQGRIWWSTVSELHDFPTIGR